MSRWMISAAVGLVLGLLAGGFAGWAVGNNSGVRVQVLEGFTSAVNYSGTAIGLARERGEGGPGYDLAGVWWRQADIGGPWTKGPATCAIPLTQGQQVRLGVIQVRSTNGAPGGTKVVWMECLDRNVMPMIPAPVEAAQGALASSLGVRPDQTSVAWIEEASWSNTSLGCPEPGRAYAEVIVPGFRIRLEHQGREYVYHTNADGSQVVTC